MVRAGHHDDAVALFDFFFRRSNIVPNIVVGAECSPDTN
jgi:pentatricopeptide repeat protein